MQALRTMFICGVVTVAIVGAQGSHAYAAPYDMTESTDVEHVVIVGAVGLRWDDVDQESTPTLWDLTGRAATGSLSVKATTADVTCPADGWVTLGAGNRARGPLDEEPGCPAEFPISAPIQEENGSWRLPDQEALRVINDGLDYGARPGMLASSVRCASAIGRQAAVAATRSSGRIDNYVSEMPEQPRSYLSQCPVTVIEAPPVLGDSTDARALTAASTDNFVSQIREALPPNSLLVVAGVADVVSPPSLHVAILEGQDSGKKQLTSATTRRNSYVQLIDVAPTALSALHVGIPSSVAGQSMRPTIAHKGNPAQITSALADANEAAQQAQPLVQPFYSILVYANLIFLIAAAIFFRRRRLAVGETLPDPAAGHGRLPDLLRDEKEKRQADLLAVAALFLAAIPGSTFAGNIIPWWRISSGVWFLWGIVIAVAVATTWLALAGPWKRHTLGPPACVASVTALLLAGDVLTGSHLQINSLAGYSPLVAGRFMGFGNYAFAIFAAGSLLAVSFLAQFFPAGSRRTIFVVSTGFVAVALVGAPAWGSDVGGIIALTPAFALLAMRIAGAGLTPLRVGIAILTGAVAVSFFAWLDYRRPDEERTHLGRFVAQILDGDAGTIVQRKAEANINLLVSSQLTLLVISVALFIPLVLLPRSAGLRRVFALYPTVKAGAAATLVAALVGFAVNDSGVAVPAFAAAVAVPLLVVTILRVLRSAGRDSVTFRTKSRLKPVEKVSVNND